MERKTLYYLKKAGWYEGRKVDMTDFYEQLEAGGYILFPTYKRFLDEFGRLEIKVKDYGYDFKYSDDYGRDYHIHSTIEEDFIGYPPYKVWNAPGYILEDKSNCGKKLLSVGQYANITLPIYIDEQGEFYDERTYLARTTEEMWDEVICSMAIYDMEHIRLRYILRRLGLEEVKKYKETKEWPEQLPVPLGRQVLSYDGLVNWGNIEAGGFVIDEEGRAIKKEYIPQYSEILDGYDTVGTRYLSPVIDGKPYEYIKRLMPYEQEQKFYEQYEVVGDFRDLKQAIVACKDQLLKQKIEAYITKVYNDDYTKLVTYSGEVAPVPFWGAGGIIQYELPLKVEWLEGIGVLRRVNGGKA